MADRTLGMHGHPKPNMHPFSPVFFLRIGQLLSSLEVLGEINETGISTTGHLVAISGFSVAYGTALYAITSLLGRGWGVTRPFMQTREYRWPL